MLLGSRSGSLFVRPRARLGALSCLEGTTSWNLEQDPLEAKSVAYLDCRESLDALLGTQRFVLLSVAVDRVRGNERVKTKSGLAVFRDHLLTVLLTEGN